MRFALPAILALALPALAQDDKDKKQCTDEEAKTHIADCKKEFAKCKTADDFIRAIESLGSKKHPKILDELKTWLGKGSIDVRIAAAEQISKYSKEEKASDALIGIAKATNARKDTMDLAIKCIRYAGDVGVRSATKSLLVYFDHRECDVAREAIDSCAKLKSKEAIDPLLNMIRVLEAVKEDQGQQNNGGQNIPGGNFPGANQPNQEDEKVKRKKELLQPAIQAMKDITGERYNTGTEWTKWWSKNKNTWKEPEDK
jgi:hypothetical protein